MTQHSCLPGSICGPGMITKSAPFTLKSGWVWAMNCMITLFRMFFITVTEHQTDWLASKGGCWFSFLERPELGQLQGWPVNGLHGVFTTLNSPCFSSPGDNIISASTQHIFQRGRWSLQAYLCCISLAQLSHRPLLNQCSNCMNASLCV